VIQLAGYDVYYKPGNDPFFFAKNLERAVELAAAHAVTLAFETMETPFLNTVEKAMTWVSRINSPWLAVYPDLGNITCAADGDGERVRADLETDRGHLAALHLKETKPGMFREVPYGSGQVDFRSGIAVALNLGGPPPSERNGQPCSARTRIFCRAAFPLKSIPRLHPPPYYCGASKQLGCKDNLLYDDPCWIQG
jgi:hypothetical protein